MNRNQTKEIIKTLVPEFTDIKIVSSKYFRSCYMYVIHFIADGTEYLFRMDISYDYVQIVTDASDTGKIIAEANISESQEIRKILDE